MRRRSGKRCPAVAPGTSNRSIVPDPSQHCVLVLDETAFARLPLPLSNPERVVLITRKDPQLLAQAWDAGIVSVVSEEDPLNTVLLAIMAAALRVAKDPRRRHSSGISPNRSSMHLRQYPHKIGLPDRNVAKSNSLASVPAWTSACTTFHSGKEAVRDGTFFSRIRVDCPKPDLPGLHRTHRRTESAAWRSPPPARCSGCFPRWPRPSSRCKSDDIQQYIDAIRRNVCSVCADQASDGSCETRQQVQCALDAYLLLVVDAIEEATGKTFDRKKLLARAGGSAVRLDRKFDCELHLRGETHEFRICFRYSFSEFCWR